MTDRLKNILFLNFKRSFLFEEPLWVKLDERKDQGVDQPLIKALKGRDKLD